MDISYISNLKRKAQREYKAITIATLSAISILSLLITQTSINTFYISSGLFFGSLQFVLLFIVANYGRKLKSKGKYPLIQKALSILFSPHDQAGIGGLILGTITISLQIYFFNIQNSILDLMSFTISFIGIIALFAIIIRLIGIGQNKEKVHYSISDERFELFLGAFLATILLGSAFQNLPRFSIIENGHGAILFPIIIAFSSIILTSTGAVFLQLNPKKPTLHKSIISIHICIALILISIISIAYYFPKEWIIEGKLYNRNTLMTIVGGGILIGLICSVLVKMYYKVTSYFLSKNKNLRRQKLGVFMARLLFNGTIGFLPFILLCGWLFFAYQSFEIYGVFIALLGMVSNFGVSLIVENNMLSYSALKSETSLQKRLDYK